jgi:ABC-type Mn2+/Zn2+ transport system permease subunit
MKLAPALFLAWLLAMLSIFGGAGLLWSLDAPSWAIAGWFLTTVRVSVRLPRNFSGGA